MKYAYTFLITLLSITLFIIPRQGELNAQEAAAYKGYKGKAAAGKTKAAKTEKKKAPPAKKKPAKRECRETDYSNGRSHGSFGDYSFKKRDFKDYFNTFYKEKGGESVTFNRRHLILTKKNCDKYIYSIDRLKPVRDRWLVTIRIKDDPKLVTTTKHPFFYMREDNGVLYIEPFEDIKSDAEDIYHFSSTGYVKKSLLGKVAPKKYKCEPRDFRAKDVTSTDFQKKPELFENYYRTFTNREDSNFKIQFRKKGKLVTLTQHAGCRKTTYSVVGFYPSFDHWRVVINKDGQKTTPFFIFVMKDNLYLQHHSKSSAVRLSVWENVLLPEGKYRAR